MIEIKKFYEFNINLENDWKFLEKNNTDIFVFQRYTWNKHWYESFSLEYNIEIQIIYFNDSPVGVFPFCLNKNGFIKKLQLIGGDQSDYLTPLIDSNWSFTYDTWCKIRNNITLNYDIILFYKIPESFNSHKNLFLNINKCIQDSYSFHIKLPESFSSFEKSLKTTFRADNRRNLKRLNEVGSVNFLNINTITEDPDFFVKKIQITIEQKDRRIKNHYGKSIMKYDLVNKFYTNSFKIIDKNFKIIYSCLILDDNTILATHWGVHDEKRFYYMLPTIEGRDWYKFSCGKLLINNLIEYAINNKFEIFDFTIGDENYKKDWCNESLSLYKLIETKSISGFVYNLKLNIISYFRNNKNLKKYWRIIKKRLVKKSKLS